MTENFGDSPRNSWKWAEKAPFLGKWLWILFWLVIPQSLASLLNSDLFDSQSVFRFLGLLLQAAYLLSYGLVLLKLSSHIARYRTAGICFLVGGMIGLLAGYYGGFLDSLLMRITDIMMAFPFTILVITIMAILGQGLINLFIALWLVGWMSYAKLVRSEVLVLKDSEFIQAARVAGFSDARILFRHLLPNVISSAVVFAASDVVMCMLTGASMSFLGLGVSPPTPEWGSILNEGRNFITFAWWPTLFPGLFLAVSGVGFSLLGDGLTDFLRTKGR